MLPHMRPAILVTSAALTTVSLPGCCASAVVMQSRTPEVLSQRKQGLVFLVLGLGSLSLAGVGLGLAQTDLELAMTALVYGVGFGFFLPMIYATAGDIIPLAARVRGLAVVLLAFDLAVAGGGIALGPLADAAGPAAALGWATIFPAFGCLLVVFGGSFRRVAASP